MLWENSIVDNNDSCDVCQCTRLFKNAFKIKSTPEGAVKSTPRSRRILGMASQRLFSPENKTQPAGKENGSAISSPISRNVSPRKPLGSKQSKSRCPLEDCDPNSQDSGYGNSQDKDECFQFAEPLGVAPRRPSMDPQSPTMSPLRSARAPLFRSLSSGYESTDECFNDLIDMEALDDTTENLPSGISNLISGLIVAPENQMECDGSTTPEFPRTKCRSRGGLRRSLSLHSEKMDRSYDSEGTPPISKVRSCLFRSPNSNCSASKLSFDVRSRAAAKNGFCESPESPLQNGKSFKRPEPPSDESPVLVKRRKSTSFQDIVEASLESSAMKKHSPLMRSFSETDSHAHIKQAIHRSLNNSDLTGDFSKACVLPLAEGKHVDLKTISSSTLASLIHGDFVDNVYSYKIVDCRYPYEFDAGHIEGAINLYTKDLIEQFLLEPLKDKPEIQPDNDRRSILVFHCEFSWERGPNLSRFLRSIDRQRNKDHYPALHYPEVYLLHGGYEIFYKEHRELCTPQGYRPMRHPDNEADLKQFRSKSKSWQGEKSRANGLTKGNLKRLGF